MYILDDEKKQKLEDVGIYLTKDEASHLLAYLQKLLTDESVDHIHFASEDHQKEMTVYLYDPENLDALGSNVKKFITDNA
jgi:hypothetical protein